MKITSKGQVTIPQDIRENADLLPNTEVRFEYAPGKLTLLPVSGERKRGVSIVTALRGSAKYTGMTTDELMVFTRGKT